jgi:hypothetical protein
MKDWWWSQFICHPSVFTVSEDAGIEPRTVATFALTVRLSNHSAQGYDGIYWEKGKGPFFKKLDKKSMKICADLE